MVNSPSVGVRNVDKRFQDCSEGQLQIYSSVLLLEKYVRIYETKKV